MAWPTGGSPPLVRGGPLRGRRVPAGRGLTPARAGRTARLPHRSTVRTAHPRSCGADGFEEGTLTPRNGSPPLVRGGQLLVGRHGSGLRLTPARAGRTRSAERAPSRFTAHPRSCGADLGQEQPARVEPGSPPLVRGGPRLRPPEHQCGRLTPARAGRTRSPSRSGTASTAHPHSCGADTNPAVSPSIRSGSPPLVRGGPLGCRHHGRPSRLTPARAGRTPPSRRPCSQSTAHPRSCGADDGAPIGCG